MGLFDRLLGSRAAKVKVSGSAPVSSDSKPADTFFLDADAASTLGDVNFMRRPNTIRHTFPGNADSPGDKELIQEVASMEARVEKSTPGLAGASTESGSDVNLTGGIPKPVKKTFAQRLGAAELQQRLKGAAVSGVNAPVPPGPARKTREEEAAQPLAGQQGTKPGAIDPFKSMARDLNA